MTSHIQIVTGLQRRIHEELNGPIPAPSTWFGRAWLRMTRYDKPDTSDGVVIGLSIFWIVALSTLGFAALFHGLNQLHIQTGWLRALSVPDKMPVLAMNYAVIAIFAIDFVVVMALSPEMLGLAGKQAASVRPAFIDARPLARPLFICVRFAFAVALWNAALFGQSLIIGDVVWADLTWATKYVFMPLLLTYPFGHYTDRTGRRPVADARSQ